MALVKIQISIVIAMEYYFVLCVIWTSFMMISSAYGSDGECADSRNDCSIFSSNCSAAPAFVIKGCPKTCGLCPVNGVNKEFHSPLTILVDNQDFQYAYASCSVYIQSIQNASLIFQCNESSEHLENIRDVNGSVITSYISIAVQYHMSLINCTCILKYMSNGSLPNQTITKQLTLRGKSFKPTFHISSSIESGLNITVKENQTVIFTCKINSTAKETLTLYKGREFIISNHNLTETIIGKTDWNSSVSHTIKGVQCSDAGEYTCQASGFHGTDKSTAYLSVLCDDDICKDDGECVQTRGKGGDTENCVDNEECSINRSAFPASCLNASWHIKHCPVSCNVCSTDLQDKNVPKTLTAYIIIIATISGVVVIIGLVIAFYVTKTSGHRIQRYQDAPALEATFERERTHSQRESNGNVYSEINEKHTPLCNDDKGVDYLNSIYVPWESQSNKAEGHQPVTF